jgi:hypothetical protein
MIRPLNLTEHQSSAKALPESADRFEQALVKWFGRHRGVWSGTASELIAAAGTDLWPAGKYSVLWAWMSCRTTDIREWYRSGRARKKETQEKRPRPSRESSAPLIHREIPVR